MDVLTFPTEFNYNLTVDGSRMKAGLNSRAIFEGQGSAIMENLTLVFLSESCANFTLELRVGAVPFLVPELY